jgi:hypothetical protein
MSMCLVYDDRASVPDDIRALLGVSRFSQVLYRKRPLLEHVRELVRDADIGEFIHLRRDADAEGLAQRLDRAPGSRRFLYYPSFVIPRCLDDARVFLKKVRYARRDIIVPVRSDAADQTHDNPGAMLLWMGSTRMRDVFEPLARGDLLRVRRTADRAFAPVGDASGLTDISRYDRFVEFLSSNFDVRHFNAIEHDGLSVRKRSRDVAKMRREHRFLSLVDGPISAFFPRVLSFEEGVSEGAPEATYSLERFHVPDMAIQWVHGALSPEEFESFLDRVESYFRVRPVRECDDDALARVGREVFVDKVVQRLARFRSMPIREIVEPILQRAGEGATLDILERRFRALDASLTRSGDARALAFTHGDPCFSNILYDRRTQLFKLIDPRGADGPDDLFSHPWYDAAKLSHSVLGSYDFINHNLFELIFDSSLGLSLAMNAPDLRPHRASFVRRMDALGFSYPLLRLREASLFLSMLPLHAENPKKIVAFALTARDILSELEGMSA